MRERTSEQVRAERLSATIDRLLCDPGAQPETFDLTDEELLATARQLARLPALLGPVEPALEQRVMGQIQAARRPSARAPHLKWAWVAAGLAVVLLVILVLSPVGQTAVASLLAVFRLGRTEVSVGPAYTPSVLPATAVAGGTAVRESLTLDEARAQVTFSIPRPTYLPAGYQLRDVHAYHYPDLPAWVPQPLFVELLYGNGREGDLMLRVYSISLGSEASISGLNLQATPIQDLREVDIDGRRGVLLRLGEGEVGVVWQEMIWEQDELILSLSSAHLAEEELLRIARSVR